MNWQKMAAGVFLTAGLLFGGKMETVRAEEISGKITVWEHAITYEAAMEALVEGFEEKYPQVEVEWEIWGVDIYYDLVSIGIQAGDGPDLFYTDGVARPQMKEYIEKGFILDLTDKVNFSCFDEATLWRETVDGKCYGVPWLTFDSRAVYYNEDMFAEHGWQIPENFQEFEALLREIQQAGIVPIDLAEDSYSRLFLWEAMLTAMYPEYVAKLNEEGSDLWAEPVRNTLQKMLDWVEAGYCGSDRFVTEEAAMTICGTWDGIFLQDNNPDINVGAFILPSVDGEKRIMGIQASGFSVNTASENMEAALAFANYCASLEGQTRWIQAKGGISASEYIESSSEVSREIAKQAEGNLYTSWQIILADRSNEAVTIWEEGMVEIFDGKTTIEEFLEEIQHVMG